MIRTTELWSFVRFLFVGATGFVVDAGLVVLLCREGVSPILARVPSITCAMLVTWLLNRAITFRVRVQKSLAELLRYAAVATVSAVLNYLCYIALISLHISPPIAVALATMALLFFSYFGYRRFAFQSATAIALLVVAANFSVPL